MIGRALFEIFVRDVASREEDLVAGRQFDIVRNVLVLEYLLNDTLEDGGGNLSALMQADGGIEDDDYGKLRIVDGREAGEGTNVFCF